MGATNQILLSIQIWACRKTSVPSVHKGHCPQLSTNPRGMLCCTSWHVIHFHLLIFKKAKTEHITEMSPLPFVVYVKVGQKGMNEEGINLLFSVLSLSVTGGR